MPAAVEINEATCAEAEKLAGHGLNMEQIASVLGMSRATLYNRQKDVPELQEAIKRGRHKGIAAVTNALYERALTGDYSAIQFYLKNRDSDHWREKSEMSLTGEGFNFVINYGPKKGAADDAGN